MGFSQGLSGLSAAAKALDVVGNNIANSQTIGFKAGSVSFADIFAGSTGMGVRVAGVDQNFGDGNLANGSSALDMGISNRGFFRMVDAAGSVFYSRNGQFDQDENGYIYNKTNGLFLTGYQATDGAINPGAQVGPIRIPKDDMPPAASTKGSLTGNLKSDAEIITKPFDKDDKDTYNYVSEVTATDSLGNKHAIKVYFVHTGEGKWQAHAEDSTSPDGIKDIELNFDTSGNIVGPAELDIQGKSYNGSAALAVKLDLSKLSQNSGDMQIMLGEIDGQAPGKFNGYEVSDSGEVIVIYSNQKRQTVAQVVLADFANVGGLAQQGNNLWAETGQSGQPFLGTSGSGSFGTINGGMLETSNVELGEEMVNMIVYQRNYQSNSQTIKTQSEVLQTLVNLR
ncbi:MULTISPECIES: flagellar hook protein FlgE [Enterobacter cloacae complex]|uniref:flagellar hook protein FlgE n=1 Tax=Enterobacter cloacae complex TaxID=354276 RepID=UPI00129D8EFF|nr:flagellar hook protein FlgE [Enterobacter cloacae]MCK7338338.1 flagellar hook protein FlgE [Enterobacter cloacae]MCR1553453.1 flagellar hook protein FlgE [Enterobacter cloacae]MCU6199966.1 flagellar hook protein FlgE [Enterobacter cloacae]MRM11404.1 flagellar hook-basal body complex protein [Enterobacter cloacae subsp. dissolvens]HDC4370693.1 flagellar hook protein FlgE [Enterobacter cloacae]